MFKDKLKELRLSNGLTQTDVAKAIGIPVGTICNYERGVCKPRNNMMWQKLADYFEVSVDELMDTQNCTIAENKTIHHLIEEKVNEYINQRTFYVKIENGFIYVYCTILDYITQQLEMELRKLFYLMRIEYETKRNLTNDIPFYFKIESNDLLMSLYIQKFIDDGYKLSWGDMNEFWFRR